MGYHHHHHHTHSTFVKWLIIVLCLVPLILMTSLLIVYLFRRFHLFGLSIEELYQEMNDGKINSDSLLTFKIESNNCTLLGKYAGPDYRLIESVGSGESCKKYTYRMGDDPDEFTEQLIDRDIMNDNIVRK